MTERVLHLAFVVERLERVVPHWEAVLDALAEIEEGKTARKAVLKSHGVEFVFMEPKMAQDSHWSRALRECGPGLDHVAISSPGLDAECEKLASRGLRLRYDVPLDDRANGHRINFVERESLQVAILELIDEFGNA